MSRSVRLADVLVGVRKLFCSGWFGGSNRKRLVFSRSGYETPSLEQQPEDKYMFWIPLSTTNQSSRLSGRIRLVTTVRIFRMYGRFLPEKENVGLFLKENTAVCTKFNCDMLICSAYLSLWCQHMVSATSLLRTNVPI